MTFFFHEYKYQRPEDLHKAWADPFNATEKFSELIQNRIAPFTRIVGLRQVEDRRWESDDESLECYVHIENGIAPNPPYWGITIISHQEKSELGKKVQEEFPELVHTRRP